MSTDEFTTPDSSEFAPPESKPAKQGSILRIVLIVILVLAVVALIIDRRSQAAAEELNATLGEMLDAAPAKRPTVDEVHAKIGREPSEKYNHDEMPNTAVEEYRFRGGLPWRSYTVYVYYRMKPEQRLYSVSLNQPEQFR